MAIFQIQNIKYIVLSESKEKGCIFEFQADMKAEELLERVNEFRDSIIKSIEETKKKEEESAQVKDQD